MPLHWTSIVLGNGRSLSELSVRDFVGLPVAVNVSVSTTDRFQTTADAIFEGATVRYHWRDGDGLATVIEKTDSHVAFSGPDCNGLFTLDQINRLFEDDRLEVVLGA